jgi:hypothetical protein
MIACGLLLVKPYKADREKIWMKQLLLKKLAYVFQIKFKINNYLMKQLKMFLQIKYIISQKGFVCIIL